MRDPIPSAIRTPVRVPSIRAAEDAWDDAHRIGRGRKARMIEYRQAEPGDAEAVAHLHARSWRESYRGSFTDAFLDGDLLGERLGVWRERLGTPPPNQLVELAVEAGGLCGFVCAYGGHDAEWGSFIDNLHVVSDMKGRGLGASLMRRAADWLERDHPDRGIFLWVLEANTAARAFYERLGAHDAGVTTMETHGGALVRSCRYTWPSPAALRDA